MKNLFIRSFEVFCKAWLAAAYLIALFFCGVFAFIGWLLSPTLPPRSDPEEGEKEENEEKLENFLGGALLLALFVASYIFLTLAS